MVRQCCVKILEVVLPYAAKVQRSRLQFTAWYFLLCFAIETSSTISARKIKKIQQIKMKDKNNETSWPFIPALGIMRFEFFNYLRCNLHLMSSF